MWEPGYPYLYRVVCSLLVSGETVDTCEIPLGIRTVRWDAETGFYINGHHLKLHGWGQKPTDEWPGLGAAQPDWLHFYTLDLMKQAGGNFVRWGHCAGGPALIAAGDRLGIIADQPGVDGESDTRGAAWKIRAAGFRDMIIYFRNNPSILIWEGGNQKVSREHAKELRGYMDKYDPHGGRAYAHRRADKITAEFMDIGIGTEGGREIKEPAGGRGRIRPRGIAAPRVGRFLAAELRLSRGQGPRHINSLPSNSPSTRFLNTSANSARRITAAARTGSSPTRPAAAAWRSKSPAPAAKSTACVCPRRPITFARRCSAPIRRCTSSATGLIPPRRRKRSMSPPTARRSNCSSTANRSVAARFRTATCSRSRMSLWNRAKSKRWPTPAAKPLPRKPSTPSATAVALRLTPITGPGGLRADGSDVALIDVEAVDAKGERCPTFQKRVDFAVEGPGVWRGGYNSGKINSINNTYLDLECGINRVAVRSERTARHDRRHRQVRRTEAGQLCQSNPLPVKVDNGAAAALPAMPVVTLPKKRAVKSTCLQSATPQTESQAQTGRFIKSFSYSGPTTSVHVEKDAQDGKKIYADSDLKFLQAACGA